MKIIKRSIASWVCSALLVSLLTVLRGGAGSLLSPDFASRTGLWLYAALFAAAFLFITAADRLIKVFSADNAALLLSVNLFALLALRYSDDITLLLGLMLPVSITDIYVALDSTDRLSAPSHRRLFFILAVAFGAAQALFIALYTCARYNNYSSPCFDFGIFCNMFASMARDFTQTVSCERDAIIQHFAVHFSPIYYLMLPFYFVFRTPLTLQVLQAVIVGSGVLPLYLIARRRRLSAAVSAALCLAYALYPALIGGCSYDMHENCFLAPLLLWLFYASERGDRRDHIMTAVFALLTLSVKEDAAVYVAFFGLYRLIADGHDGVSADAAAGDAETVTERTENGACPLPAETEPSNTPSGAPLGKRVRAALGRFFTPGRRCGISLLLASIAWFLFTTWFLSRYGYGIMSYRYDNFMTDGGSLVGVIINVLKNPVLVFSESFEAEKLTFLAQALLPLALLPFITRRPHRLLLLFPFLLIGLMSDYKYQHSIFFQYVFGWSAFLFYASVLNLADLSRKARRSFLAVMLSASALFFTAYAAPLGRAIFPSERTKEACAEIDKAIDFFIPDDASVTCSTFILPHLADREIIYELEDGAQSADTDYVVFDLRYSSEAETDGRELSFSASGYETVLRLDGRVMIMAIR